MKNVLIFLFILILAPLSANAQFPDNENDIRWSLYKNGPVKDKRGRSGVYLPTAIISDAGLTFQSCIGMSLPYAIVTKEQNLVSRIQELENQETWIKEHITYTPALFFNGYEFPENYHIEDLLYIL